MGCVFSKSDEELLSRLHNAELMYQNAVTTADDRMQAAQARQAASDQKLLETERLCIKAQKRISFAQDRLNENLAQKGKLHSNATTTTPARRAATAAATGDATRVSSTPTSAATTTAGVSATATTSSSSSSSTAAANAPTPTPTAASDGPTSVEAIAPGVVDPIGTGGDGIACSGEVIASGVDPIVAGGNACSGEMIAPGVDPIVAGGSVIACSGEDARVSPKGTSRAAAAAEFEYHTRAQKAFLAMDFSAAMEEMDKVLDVNPDAVLPPALSRKLRMLRDAQRDDTGYGGVGPDTADDMSTC